MDQVESVYVVTIVNRGDERAMSESDVHDAIIAWNAKHGEPENAIDALEVESA